MTYPVGLGTGLLPPQSILANRYIIVQKVGQGGMGAVYQATDTRLGHKLVAVKELSDAAITDPQEKQQVRQAFEREAQMLATLSHPNLPRVTDHFSEGGKQYLVMDFIEGRTLEEILDQTPGFLGEKQVVDWGVQLCEVLEYLHSQQPPVIFRDLKLTNIMLHRDGKVKLIDFGIARLFKPGKATDTASFGTAGYAPPEQYGKGQTDARSDIYALGATLHHLLTRRDPAQMPFHFLPVRSLNLGVSAAVDQAILRAVEQDPNQRWQSARQMQHALVSPQPAAATLVAPAPISAVVPPATVAAPQPPAAVKPRPSPTPAPTAVTRASTGRFLVTIVITAAVFVTPKVLLPIWGFYDNVLLRSLFYALWWISGPLAYMITRRPGAAFLTSGLDTITYSMLRGGGMNLWELIPTVVMEGVFAIRSYRRYNYGTLVLATVLAAIADLGVLFVHWHVPLSLDWIVPFLNGAFLGGSIAYAIGRILGK